MQVLGYICMVLVAIPLVAVLSFAFVAQGIDWYEAITTSSYQRGGKK